MIGDVADRFAIVTAQAQDRLIWFTGNAVAGYPPMASALRRAAISPS